MLSLAFVCLIGFRALTAGQLLLVDFGVTDLVGFTSQFFSSCVAKSLPG
jgi:hypothetical protein